MNHKSALLQVMRKYAAAAADEGPQPAPPVKQEITDQTPLTPDKEISDIIGNTSLVAGGAGAAALAPTLLNKLTNKLSIQDLSRVKELSTAYNLAKASPNPDFKKLQTIGDELVSILDKHRSSIIPTYRRLQPMRSTVLADRLMASSLRGKPTNTLVDKIVPGIIDFAKHSPIRAGLATLLAAKGLGVASSNLQGFLNGTSTPTTPVAGGNRVYM